MANRAPSETALRHTVGRVGLALVLLWFGAGELLTPSTWIGYIPTSMQHLPISANWMILIHGWVLFVIGGFLLLGLYTRLMGILGTIVMLSIVLTLLAAHGMNSIVARDIGITALAASVALDRTRAYSWEAYEDRRTAS